VIIPFDRTQLHDFWMLQGHYMWHVVELFANLDLAQLSAIVPNQMLETFGAPWNNAAESPGEQTSCANMGLFSAPMHLTGYRRLLRIRCNCHRQSAPATA
jgi:hypothetical protein